MAARKKTSKVKSTGRKARAKAGQAQANVIENVQHIWLAGMGAVAKAQKEGPAAFEEAVAEGLQVLTRSRSTAEKMIRDVFESAQGSVQTRFGSAREQAAETWDNLEALFQSRVQKALQQIGVPTASEIRLLTKRVAELNDNVKRLSARSSKARRAPARGKAKARRAAA
ncbi:MAG TPA: phasin family protein [Steroidobacteraceae bacterium]|jgi:poly(hydroxyalkanoate) granule-associated protein|nr:phasin family protein [Steroidobacteraceae bacterium]